MIQHNFALYDITLSRHEFFDQHRKHSVIEKHKKVVEETQFQKTLCLFMEKYKIVSTKINTKKYLICFDLFLKRTSRIIYLQPTMHGLSLKSFKTYTYTFHVIKYYQISEKTS